MSLNENYATLKENLGSKTIYNQDTDRLDVYVDGVVIGSLYCGFQVFDILMTSVADWNTDENAELSVNTSAFTLSIPALSGLSATTFIGATKSTKIDFSKYALLVVEGSIDVYDANYDARIKVSPDGATWTILKEWSGDNTINESIDVSSYGEEMYLRVELNAPKNSGIIYSMKFTTFMLD